MPIGVEQARRENSRRLKSAQEASQNGWEEGFLLTQHAEVTAERWSHFDLCQQVLQIGAEMHRAMASLRVDRIASLRFSYERVLRLVDLTVEVNPSQSLRRELRCFRELISDLHQRGEPDPESHKQALRALLRLHPVSAEQVELLGL